MDHSMPATSSAPSDQHSFFPQIQQTEQSSDATGRSMDDPSFNVINWHGHYQSCQRYFVNHAQHTGSVQTVAAFINIRLPFQSLTMPLMNIPSHSSPASTSPSAQFTNFHHATPQFGFPGASHSSRAPAIPSPLQSAVFVSLTPFIRRLVITGFDHDAIMHGFFGEEWAKGVGPLQEVERRNYLFAAKSVGWAQVKTQYDILPDQTVPFLNPLSRAKLSEIEQSEKNWSEWLAMEDWMVGPRAPSVQDRGGNMPTPGTDHHQQLLHQHFHNHDVSRRSGSEHMSDPHY